MIRLRQDHGSLPAYVAGSRVTPVDGREFRLASNELPWGPAPGVIDAGAAVLSGANRYPDLSGTPLAERLAEHLSVPAERVVVGGGSVSLLQLLLQSVLDPGGSVVFGWRSYEAYPILVRVCHGAAVPVPLSDERLDVAAMVAAVRRTAAPMLILCNPNNPTGTSLTRSEMQHVLEAVPRDCLVVIDEAYRELVDDDAFPDGVEVARDRENVAVLRTFSKAHALAGVRVGYCVAPAELAALMRRVALPFPVSEVAQAMAIAALDHWPAQRRRVDELVRLRDELVTGLRAQGHRVPASQTNFVWLRAGERTTRLTAALAGGGVSVRPFAGEGLRISVGERDALQAVLSVTGRPESWAVAVDERSSGG